jgi:hypothetical protein
MGENKNVCGKVP